MESGFSVAFLQFIGGTPGGTPRPNRRGMGRGMGPGKRPDPPATESGGHRAVGPLTVPGMDGEPEFAASFTRLFYKRPVSINVPINSYRVILPDRSAGTARNVPFSQSRCNDLMAVR